MVNETGAYSPLIIVVIGWILILASGYLVYRKKLRLLHWLVCPVLVPGIPLIILAINSDIDYFWRLTTTIFFIILILTQGYLVYKNKIKLRRLPVYGYLVPTLLTIYILADFSFWYYFPLILQILALIWVLAPGYVAYKKNRSVLGWLFLSVLLYGFPLIVIPFLKPLEQRNTDDKTILSWLPQPWLMNLAKVAMAVFIVVRLSQSTIDVISMLDERPTCTVAENVAIFSGEVSRDVIELEQDQTFPASYLSKLTKKDIEEKIMEPARLGDAGAQFALGKLYYMGGGAGLNQNYGRAVRWFKKSSKQGYAPAQFSLGVMYKRGLGIRRSLIRAEDCFRGAAEQGHVKAQFMMGELHRTHWTKSKEQLNMALYWLKKAAGQGDVDALAALCAVYLDDDRMERNYTEAECWCRKGAEQGSIRALTNMGRLYYEGRGVPLDYAQATRFYRKAAERGSAIAQNNLGNMLDKGQGVPRNYAEAMSWYERAAEQGYAIAQYNLGMMYYRGRVGRDYISAYKWLSLARRHGVEDVDQFSDRLAQSMTPEEISQAKKLVREWKAKKDGPQ